MSVKMAGQTMTDRLLAARHSIAGQGLAKSVCKATTEELIGPKKKHLDYLIHCTNEPNVSIPQLANLLIERSQNSSWVVVFKALITVHHLMCYGNERFTQYLASSNCTFQLSNFLDKSGVQGYDMSPFIRKYAKYLNEKAMSYRTVAFDFCKVKRGKEDGVLRTLTGEKLLKTIPVLQAQLDALLDFDCTPADLSNGVINMAFMMLFRDLIRLFAGYNDSIINLLEKFFEMNKKQCRQALDLYKKFLIRMDRVGEFLKVAENAGIDKGEIPDLTKAPSSLLDALEQHLNALEGKRAPTANTPTQSKKSYISSPNESLTEMAISDIVKPDEGKFLYIEVDSEYHSLEQHYLPASPTNPFFHELLWTVSKKYDVKKSKFDLSFSNPFLYPDLSCQRTDVKSAVSALNSTSSSFGSAVHNSEIGVEEAIALAEEEAAINHFKVAKVQSPTGQPATNPFLVSSPTQPIVDLFGGPSPPDNTGQMGVIGGLSTKASDDLLQLGNPFADMFGGSAPAPAVAPAAVAPQTAVPPQNNNLWMSNGFSNAGATAQPVTNSFVPDSAFNTVFGTANSNSTQPQAAEGIGQVVNPFTGLPEDVGPAPPRPPPPSSAPPRPDQPILTDLTPSPIPQTSSPSPAHKPLQPTDNAAATGKVLTGDLDTSLAMLAENLTINKAPNKGNMQWNSPKNTAKPGQPPAWNPQPMAATTTANYRPMGQGMMGPSPFPSMQPMGMAMGGSPRMQQATQPQPLDPFGAL